MVIHCVMSDEALIRRARLRSLKLTPSQLSTRLGKTPSYFSDLMKEDGKKSFGEKAARAIEQGLQLPPFWLEGRAAEQADIKLDVGEPEQPSTIEAALKVLGASLALPMDDYTRKDVADLLFKLAERRGEARHQAELATLLNSVRALALIPSPEVELDHAVSELSGEHGLSHPQVLGGATTEGKPWDPSSEPRGISNAPRTDKERVHHFGQTGSSKTLKPSVKVKK